MMLGDSSDSEPGAATLQRAGDHVSPRSRERAGRGPTRDGVLRVLSRGDEYACSRLAAFGGPRRIEQRRGVPGLAVDRLSVPRSLQRGLELAPVIEPDIVRRRARQRIGRLPVVRNLGDEITPFVRHATDSSCHQCLRGRPEYRIRSRPASVRDRTKCLKPVSRSGARQPKNLSVRTPTISLALWKKLGLGINLRASCGFYRIVASECTG